MKPATTRNDACATVARTLIGARRHTVGSLGMRVAAGCLIALDSDAHSPPELRYAETAIAHARLAGVPKDRIINCWPVEQLVQWLATKTAR